MTDEKVYAAVDGYAEWLRSEGATPVRQPHGSHAEHLLWMCEQIPGLVAAGRTEKAMRWLGFVQGALWQMGVRSVEQLRGDNRT